MHHVMPLLLALLLVAGCAGSAPTQYYLLEAMAPTAVNEKSDEAIIAVNPVTLPAYLDRPDIVTRSTDNRLDLADFDNWAEPLDDNITRVLAANLGHLLGTDRVIILPTASEAGNLEIRVDINRFEREPNGECVLVASWMILDGQKGRRRTLLRKSSLRETAAGDGYDATVAAMNRALDRLSQEIADEIGALRSSS
jgi:uncharacterized protein